MELILDNFNPWWRLKRVPSQFLGKPRDILTWCKNFTIFPPISFPAKKNLNGSILQIPGLLLH